MRPGINAPPKRAPPKINHNNEHRPNRRKVLLYQQPQARNAIPRDTIPESMPGNIQPGPNRPKALEQHPSFAPVCVIEVVLAISMK